MLKLHKRRKNDLLLRGRIYPKLNILPAYETAYNTIRDREKGVTRLSIIDGYYLEIRCPHCGALVDFKLTQTRCEKCGGRYKYFPQLEMVKNPHVIPVNYETDVYALNFLSLPDLSDELFTIIKNRMRTLLVYKEEYEFDVRDLNNEFSKDRKRKYSVRTFLQAQFVYRAAQKSWKKATEEDKKKLAEFLLEATLFPYSLVNQKMMPYDENNKYSKEMLLGHHNMKNAKIDIIKKTISNDARRFLDE